MNAFVVEVGFVPEERNAKLRLLDANEDMCILFLLDDDPNTDASAAALAMSYALHVRAVDARKDCAQKVLRKWPCIDWWSRAASSADNGGLVHQPPPVSHYGGLSLFRFPHFSEKTLFELAFRELDREGLEFVISNITEENLLKREHAQAPLDIAATGGFVEATRLLIDRSKVRHWCRAMGTFVCTCTLRHSRGLVAEEELCDKGRNWNDNALLCSFLRNTIRKQDAVFSMLLEMVKEITCGTVVVAMQRVMSGFLDLTVLDKLVSLKLEGTFEWSELWTFFGRFWNEDCREECDGLKQWLINKGVPVSTNAMEAAACAANWQVLTFFLERMTCTSEIDMAVSGSSLLRCVCSLDDAEEAEEGLAVMKNFVQELRISEHALSAATSLISGNAVCVLDHWWATSCTDDMMRRQVSVANGDIAPSDIQRIISRWKDGASAMAFALRAGRNHRMHAIQAVLQRWPNLDWWCAVPVEQVGAWLDVETTWIIPKQASTMKGYGKGVSWIRNGELPESLVQTVPLFELALKLDDQDALEVTLDHSLQSDDDLRTPLLEVAVNSGSVDAVRLLALRRKAAADCSLGSSSQDEDGSSDNKQLRSVLRRIAKFSLVPKRWSFAEFPSRRNAHSESLKRWVDKASLLMEMIDEVETVTLVHAIQGVIDGAVPVCLLQRLFLMHFEDEKSIVCEGVWDFICKTDATQQQQGFMKAVEVLLAFRHRIPLPDSSINNALSHGNWVFWRFFLDHVIDFDETGDVLKRVDLLHGPCKSENVAGAAKVLKLLRQSAVRTRFSLDGANTPDASGKLPIEYAKGAVLEEMRWLFPGQYAWKASEIRASDLTSCGEPLKLGGGSKAVVRPFLYNDACKVAVKMYASSMRENLVHEFGIGSLVHFPTLPHLLGWVDFGPDMGIGIVMELYGENANLFFRARQPFLGIELKVRWAQQVAAALRYLHSRTLPITHGDVHASNVLLPNDNAILCDFDRSCVEGVRAEDLRCIGLFPTFFGKAAREATDFVRQDWLLFGFLLVQMASGGNWDWRVRREELKKTPLAGVISLKHILMDSNALTAGGYFLAVGFDAHAIALTSHVEVKRAVEELCNWWQREDSSEEE